MSDLPSDLRRLQEQLTPEPWFHNGLQTDDLSDDYRLANAIFNTDGGGDPIPHDKELKLLRRPEPGEPKEADAETSNANLRAIVELRNLLPRILAALAAPAVKPLEDDEPYAGDAWVQGAGIAVGVTADSRGRWWAEAHQDGSRVVLRQVKTKGEFRALLESLELKQ